MKHIKKICTLYADNWYRNTIFAVLVGYYAVLTAFLHAGVEAQSRPHATAMTIIGAAMGAAVFFLVRLTLRLRRRLQPSKIMNYILCGALSAVFAALIGLTSINFFAAYGAVYMLLFGGYSGAAMASLSELAW